MCVGSLCCDCHLPNKEGGLVAGVGKLDGKLEEGGL